jgi:hypothetical protein
MVYVKKYDEFITEEINLKQALSGALLSSILAFSQPTYSQTPTGDSTKTEIVKQDDILPLSGVVKLDSTFNKSTLYSNALSFFANAFKSANAVIQMKDAEVGKVIGKGIADDREVTITIECKDGKYKYNIDIQMKEYEFTLATSSISGSKGVTKATITFIDGVPSFPEDKIYFEFNNNSWSQYKYYYDETTPGHYPALGTKAGYEKWKEDVTNELVEYKNKVEQLKDPSDPTIQALIQFMKSEMSKSSDW